MIDEPGFPNALRDGYAEGGRDASPPSRPGCPSLPRIAEAALSAAWSADEVAHVSGCRWCQRLLAFEYRAECPDLITLARHEAGVSPFEDALRAHLEEDRCERCARRLGSAWVEAVAALLRAGALTAAALREMGRGVAEVSLNLASAPSFLPSGGSGDIQQIHAAGPDGLIGLTLRQEGPRVVAYVETPNPALAGRAVSVEVLGRQRRMQARMVLGLVDGVGAFGSQDLGLMADFLTRIGPDCEILAALER
ncbi:MAG: hypothetical protein ABSF25_26325 [Bryobacteraceae bacterium]